MDMTEARQAQLREWLQAAYIDLMLMQKELGILSARVGAMERAIVLAQEALPPVSDRIPYGGIITSDTVTAKKAKQIGF